MRGLQALREFIALVLRLTMLPLIVREVFQRNRVTILLYHRISAPLFEKHMKYLLKHYSFITLQQFIEAKNSHNIKQLPKKAVIITFDDGNRSIYELKDIIQKYNIPVTIFVCSEILGTKRRFWFNYTKKLTPKLKRLPDAQRLRQLSLLGFDEQQDYDLADSISLEEASDLLKIGVSLQPHSRTHPILPMCDYDKAKNEIGESKTDIENKLGVKATCFAFPNGDYRPREIDLLRQHGYMAAVTADPGFNNANTDAFRLKRLSIHDDDSVNQLIVKASGLWNIARIFILDGRWFKSSFGTYCTTTGLTGETVTEPAVKNADKSCLGTVQKPLMNILFYWDTKPDRSITAGWITHISEVLDNLHRMGHVIRYVDGSLYTNTEWEENIAPDLEKHKESLWTRFINLIATSPIRGPAWLLLNTLKEARTFFYATNTVIRHRPDVIYRRHWHFNSDYFISRLFRIPLVKEVNSLGSDELAISKRVDRITLWLHRRIERYNLSRADKIIVVTSELKELLQSEYGIESDKIMVIYNGANIELFKPIDMYQARAELRLSAEYRYICFIGNLAPWQGIDCLIQSAPRVFERCHEARFLIVGDGLMSAELIALAKKVGVEDKVIFTRSVPYEKVPFYINSSEICVAPFVQERNEIIGLSPLKLYEYLACGKPVVASEIAGVNETLKAANAGITVTPKDPEKLADAIIELLNNNELRKQMGENGRNYVVMNHSWQKISEMVAETLYSTISKKKSTVEIEQMNSRQSP